jgi:hypothetical protein
MLIGAAVLVAVLAAGGMFYARGKQPAASPATVQVPAQQPLATSAPAPASTVPAVTGGTSTVATTGAPPTTTAAAVPSPAAEGPNPALAADIKTTTAHAANESTARRALDEVKRLETLATSSEDKVSVAMARAQAYGTLGEDAKSCKAMKAVEGISKGTTHEVQIRDMLAICAKL